MKAEEAERIERLLAENGYIKHTNALRGNATFGMLKPFRNRERLMFQIEYAFWDFRKFAKMNPSCSNELAFGVEVFVIFGGNKRADFVVQCGTDVNVNELEDMAFKFNDIIRKSEWM